MLVAAWRTLLSLRLSSRCLSLCGFAVQLGQIPSCSTFRFLGPRLVRPNTVLERRHNLPSGVPGVLLSEVKNRKKIQHEKLIRFKQLYQWSERSFSSLTSDLLFSVENVVTDIRTYIAYFNIDQKQDSLFYLWPVTGNRVWELSSGYLPRHCVTLCEDTTRNLPVTNNR